jgi:serine protease Do
LGVVCLACGLMASGQGWAGSPAVISGNPRRTPVVEVVERVRPAVVNIHSERTVKGPAADQFFAAAPTQHRVNGMGTGIIVDPRGYIVTNQHVVDDVNVIRVRLHDGTSHPARVVARDTEHDLALLKIDAPRPLTTIHLGTSSDLMVGEPVLAIGNAYGYEHTLTTGVVSAIKRDVALNKEVQYKGLIQTDASINPGNSGGPLLNIHGELIGVNVAIRAGAQNIGFAIPVDSMIQATAELLSLRRRTGIRHGLIVRDLVETTNNPVDRSVRAEAVEPASPAFQAGIRDGDIIEAIDGIRIRCSLDVERAFLDKSGGDKMVVMVRRLGEVKKLTISLPEVPTRVASSPIADVVRRKLGVTLGPVELDVVTKANPQLRGGMRIESVDEQSAAASAGIQRGDILVGLHQYETLNEENVRFVVTHPDLAKFSPLRFFVIRDGQIRRGWFANLPE